MKEIQDECTKINDCSKCDLYSNSLYSNSCLLDWNLNGPLPCYWNTDEKIDEIKEAIELDEALAKKGD